jgi:exonuclease III
MNISTTCPKQGMKIAAILALQTSIIFLSDLRLNTDNIGFSNLFSPKYNMHHNSKVNKRGVGILISNNLQYSILREFKDEKCNILGLKTNLCGSEVLLISIYGPNTDDKGFYNFLKQVLGECAGIPVICAGAWNATYCTDPGTGNIDIINMNSPPSYIRSCWLAEICDEFNLTDPYRALHFDRIDFTYVPRTGARNRSRIDFFLLSDSLLMLANKCNISDSIQTDLFDHKSIFLSFDVTKKQKKTFY